MGREQDIKPKEVATLISIVEKVSKILDMECGRCLRAHGSTRFADFVKGCPYCLSRAMMITIRLRQHKRLAILNRTRDRLRAAGLGIG